MDKESTQNFAKVGVGIALVCLLSEMNTAVSVSKRLAEQGDNKKGIEVRLNKCIGDDSFWEY